MKNERGMLRSAGLNNTARTVIYIHGFGEYAMGPSSRTIGDAYLILNQDYNIILMDWGKLAAFLWYQQAAGLSKFVRFYHRTGELPILNLHLIGFSLGAHIAGLVGKSLQGPQKVFRITGLDPTFILHATNDSLRILSKTDAEYVEAIHTSPGTFGHPLSLGHADFYPNAGALNQPCCNIDSLLDLHAAEQFVFCSHQRAGQFYSESVRNHEAFPATKCIIANGRSIKQFRFTKDVYMGFVASKNATLGDFYLTTNERMPFGKSAEEQKVDIK